MNSTGNFILSYEPWHSPEFSFKVFRSQNSNKADEETGPNPVFFLWGKGATKEFFREGRAYIEKTFKTHKKFVSIHFCYVFASRKKNI